MESESLLVYGYGFIVTSLPGNFQKFQIFGPLLAYFNFSLAMEILRFRIYVSFQGF